MEQVLKIRNLVSRLIYKGIVKKACFLIDPEKVHNRFISLGRFLGNSWLSKYLINASFGYRNNMLEQNILGIKFSNPVGISAGFDKNAELLNILGDVGFGFAEVGSVTYNSCSGNPGVRLIRIPEKKSIWVNLGLNNKGAVEISKSLRGRNFSIPFGISIAKTNCRETVNVNAGIKDYIESLKEFEGTGEYYTLNISCPNAYGGQPFHKPELFALLLKEFSKLKIKKPVFVKLSPDIKKQDIDKIISLSYKYNISGFICSNLTKTGNKSGGLSGKIVESKANALLSYIYKKTGRDFILIGTGGIFSAEDAYKKIKSGASLVQLITGMIYEGPGLISGINMGLVRLLKEDGYLNISEAIGAGVK